MSQTATAAASSRGRGRGGSRPTPTVRVPASLVTSGNQDAKVVASPGVPGGAFPVVIGGPHGVTSITYHHPIGCSNLSADEWVATPTSDVVTLLARAKNPGQVGAEKGFETHRLEAAVSRSLLTKTGARYFLPGDITTREDRLAKAKADAKAKLAQGQTPNRAQTLEELPQALREAERALEAFMSSDAVRQAARAANPVPAYETRGGPLADRSQVALSWLKGKTEQQARDLVVLRLCQI